MNRALEAGLRGSRLVDGWRWWRRRSLLILTVHGVTASQVSAQWEPLRPRLDLADLDAALALLSRAYRFVPLQQAVDMITGRRPLLQRSAVLTFDDGYATQVSDTAAVLTRHAVPATVFVCTGNAESRVPLWFDRLDFALQQVRFEQRPVAIGNGTVTLDGSSRERLAHSYGELRRAAKAVARDDREMVAELDRLSAQLEQESGRRLLDGFESDPWSRLLTPDEIASSPSLFTFGSHTVDHLRAQRLPEAVLRDQLSRSGQALARWAGGRRSGVFCYPDGGVSARAAELVRSCGYDGAVTTEPGLNTAGDDPMWLRRIDLPLGQRGLPLLATVSGLLPAVFRCCDRVLRRTAG